MSDNTYMYLVVNKQLGMSTGKIAAQCGHAVQQLMTAFYDIESRHLDDLNDDELRMIHVFRQWLSDPAKVVLECEDMDTWQNLLKLLDHGGVLVVDEGRTEVAPESETVMGFWPMYKSKQPNELRKLQCLKDQQNQ